MSFKQRKFECNQQNKHIVFGYIKNAEKLLWKNEMNIPQLIAYQCLFYYDEDIDEWERKATHHEININQQQISFFERSNDENDYIVDRNAYLTNVVKDNIHSWTFKLIDIGNGTVIGIWKINKGEPNNDAFFHHEANDGYGLILKGGFNDGAELLNPTETDYNYIDQYHEKYGIECNDNDIIEMILDFRTLTLSFKINNIDYGKAFDVENTGYRVKLNTYGNHIKCELLNYKKRYINPQRELIKYVA